MLARAMLVLLPACYRQKVGRLGGGWGLVGHFFKDSQQGALCCGMSTFACRSWLNSIRRTFLMPVDQGTLQAHVGTGKTLLPLTVFVERQFFRRLIVSSEVLRLDPLCYRA